MSGPMTKTAAMRVAQNAVDEPIGQGTSWQVYGPSHDNAPRWGRTSRSATCYAAARAIRTRWVAAITLALMGVDDDGFYLHHNSGSARELVNLTLRKRAATRPQTEGV